MLQTAWVQIRPTTVQLMKGTIGALQRSVDQIETQLTADGSSAQPLDFSPLQNAAQGFWQKTQPLWAKLIGWVRSRLPEDVNQQLGDRSLSGLLAGLGLLLLWITSHLPVASARAPVAPAPPPTAITQRQPAAPTSAPPTVPTTPSVSDLRQKFPVDAPPDGTTAVPPALKAGEQAKPAGQPVGIKPLAPAVSTSPAPATGAPTPPSPVAPAPAAPVKLTREQQILATLQDATNPYADKIAAAVTLTSASGQVHITLGDRWYSLTPQQQDQLAATLWQQSQDLKFSSLEVVDRQDHVLARSPIVGSEMVILQRQPV
jgi:hypothetical protein